MALSPQEFERLKLRLQAEKTPLKSEDILGQKSGMQQFAETVASPFARTAVTVQNLKEGTGRLLSGDIRGANEALSKSREMGFLGKVDPVIKGETENLGQDFKNIVGTGLEIGSYFGGAGAARQTVRGLASQGAKTGAATGVASAGGVELGREDATLGSVAKQSVLGGVSGGLVGGILGGSFGLLKRRASVAPGQSVIGRDPGELPTPVFKTGFIDRQKQKVAGLDTPEINTVVTRLTNAVDKINQKIETGALTKERGVKVLGKALAKKESEAINLGKKFDTYLDAARKGADDFNLPSAMGVAGEQAERTLEKLNQSRQLAGQVKGSILERVKDKTLVGLNNVKSRFRTLVNERMGADFSEDGLISLPGRISRITSDPSESKLITKAKAILDELGDSDNLLKVDDAIDTLQALIDSEKALSAVQRKTKAEGVISNIINDLGKRVYAKAGKKYIEANREYAKIIRVYDALNKRLQFDPKLGTSRGDALMKQVFSPAGNTVRGIFKKAEEITGDNLIDDAIMARLAMKIVGDTRADSLLENTAGAVLEGSGLKDSVIKGMVRYLGKKFVNPEDIARKELQRGGVIFNNKPTSRAFKRGAVPQTALGENYGLYTVPGQKSAEIFSNSRNQKLVGSFSGIKFDLGDYGRSAFKRKTGNKDRFRQEELEKTIGHIKAYYRASDDPKNFRYDNIVWISEMPDKTKRAIYTRLNALGNEEIINWHNLSQPERFTATLKTFGAPNRT